MYLCSRKYARCVHPTSRVSLSSFPRFSLPEFLLNPNVSVTKPSISPHVYHCCPTISLILLLLSCTSSSDCSGCYEFAVDSNTYTCEPIIPAGSIHALSIDWPLSYSPGATNLNGAPFYVTNMSGPDGGSEATPLLLGQRDHLQFHAIMHMNASHNIMLELEQSERTYDNMTERETQDLNGCYATCQIGNTIASCLDW